MIVGVPKETYPGERRAALSPDAAALLVKAGLEVRIEQGAGVEAGFPDALYQDKGATIASSAAELFASADVVARVHLAGDSVAEPWCEGQVGVGLLNPLGAREHVTALAEKGVTAFALELLPRISRAQSMDALSSMATIAGYKAVLIAANALPRMFPMMMTAAGTVHPARVFVVGAGVAGLQAIATARRLGARVQSYDVRPAVKEQVESLGAKFVELDLEEAEAEDKGGYAKARDEEFYRRQQEKMAEVVKESDVVITTAAVPGRKAPELVSAEMVSKMQPGSVVVDLAAETGGNCALTRPGEVVREFGVAIHGPVNLPASVPYHASQMYGKNIATFLLHLHKEGALQIDADDEIIRDSKVAQGGKIVNARVREAFGLDAPPQEEK